jgi:hypothetical protein
MRFPQRNRWRKGRWLVIDDVSGRVLYSDQVARQWDGLIVDKRQVEQPNPQWYVRSKANDPRTLPFTRPDAASAPSCTTIAPYDASGRLRAPFPGYNIFVGTGVGTMEIGCSWMVYPDAGPFPPS